MYQKLDYLIWLALLGVLVGGTALYGFDADRDPSLVALWRLDDGMGTTVLDSSPNGNHGTISGDPEWVPGVYEAALAFDGDGDYVDFGNDAVFDITEEITLAIWVNANDLGNGQHNMWLGKGDNAYAIKHQNGNNIEFFIYDGSWNSINYTTGLADLGGEWHHMTGTFDGTELLLYVDGENVDSLTLNSTINTSTHSVRIAENSQATGRFYDGMLDDARIYNRALTAEEILLVMAGGIKPELASQPVPEDEETDVFRDVELAWTPGEVADSHNVYLGTSWEDVNDATVDNPLGVLVSEEQTPAILTPGRLEFSQTYYWRVDEVNSPTSPGAHKGNIWSFTVEPRAYPIISITATASSSFLPTMDPARTIDGSGLDDMDQHGTTGPDMWLTAPTDTERWVQYEFNKAYKLHEMWVWNSNQNVESFIGFGAKDVTVELSVDGSAWVTLENVPEFTQAPGTVDYDHNTTVDMGGQMAKFVKLTIHDNWGSLPQAGLSEVRFYFDPVFARNPEPVDGGTSESINAVLQWRPGREADQHEVVLSSDLAQVESGAAIVATIPDSRYETAPLNYSTTYFWRINETNDVGTPPRYEGDIWQFTAPEYLVIDDFEMYIDEEFLEIWSFWSDGYQDDTDGSIVGNGNIGETTVVFEGDQSMPIHYDNSSAPLSEVTRSFDPPLDWSTGEPNTLSLQLRGQPADFLENADGTMVIGAAGADIWDVEDEFRFVYKRLSGDGSITAKVEDMISVHAWTKAGVMIRESLTQESSYALVLSSAENGTRYQYRLNTFTSASADDAAMDGIQENLPPAPVWLKVERMGNEINGYYKTDEAGAPWVPMGENPVEISMVPDVYIGLAITSHDVDNSAVVTFSNVTTTGGVSGAWTAEAVGGTHPSNDPASMYVVIKDTSGNEKRVSHPNPNATLIPIWEEWILPLGDMGSVNLGRIDSVTIGVEKGNNAQGTVFVDLLRVGTPLPPVAEPNEPVIE